MAKKIVFIQHQDLSEGDLEDLKELCQYMAQRTEIETILIPKNIDFVGKEEVQEFINKLQDMINNKPLNQEYIDQIPKE